MLGTNLLLRCHCGSCESPMLPSLALHRGCRRPRAEPRRASFSHGSSLRASHPTEMQAIPGSRVAGTH